MIPKSCLYCLCLLLMLCGCRHKELCYDHPHSREVEVRFHWGYDVQPAKAMRVLCYPLSHSRSEPYGFDIGNSRGGLIDLPAGAYEVLAYSLDTENIIIEGESDAKLLQAYTRELTWARSRRGSRDALPIRTVDAPDYMARAYVPQTLIRSTAERQYIDLYPEEAVCRFTLEVHGIRGLSFVRQSRVSLSHVAPSLFLKDMRLDGLASEALFDTRLEGDVLRGQFNIFGLFPLDTKAPKYELTLFFITADKNVYATYDVSEQIKEAQRAQGHIRHVHLVLSVDIQIAKPIGNGGGFRPEVDDWQAIEKDIDV